MLANLSERIGSRDISHWWLSILRGSAASPAAAYVTAGALVSSLHVLGAIAPTSASAGALFVRRSCRDVLWRLPIRIVDAALRRLYRIEPYTADPACVLRVALVPAPRTVRLADKIVIQPGEEVIALHFWNEQLPRFSSRGPDFLWGVTVRRAMQHSLSALARQVAENPAWRDIRAIHACVAFGNRPGQLRRTASRFGFELVEGDAPPMLRGLGEDLVCWGLIRAFNPGALRRHCFRRARSELWMSRTRLLDRYGVTQVSLGPAALIG